MKKCGFVSLVGRPNVGKSTLLNSILNIKLAITSDKVGTTRNVIHGIYNDKDSQIVFVDTPGIAKPIHKLNQVLNKKAYHNTEGVELILFLVDISSGFGRGDEYILNQIKDKDVPVFLLLNKIDKIKKEELIKRISSIQEKHDFAEIIPISAKKKDNIGTLLKCIKGYLHDSEPYYDEEELTNISVKFMMAELVREQVLRHTKDEIPHTVTCYTEEYHETEDRVDVSVLVVVDRENVKKMIIGKQASMIKEIGTKARHEMEAFLGKKVFLQTYVKTMKNWRDREKYLLELGLKEMDE